MNEIVKAQDDHYIYHMLYAKGLSFNLVKNPFFKKVVEPIGNHCKECVPISLWGQSHNPEEG